MKLYKNKTNKLGITSNFVKRLFRSITKMHFSIFTVALYLSGKRFDIDKSVLYGG